MTDFDDIIDDVGTIGPYQIRVVMLVGLFQVVPTMCVLMPVFIEALPDWECNAVNCSTVNMTSPSLLKSDTNSSVYDAPEAFNLTRSQKCDAEGRFCEGVAFHSNVSTIRTEWDLCGEDFLVSPITMFPMVGTFLGALVFGQLGDTFGRKPMLFLSYSLLLVAQGTMCFTHAWHFYIICRFLVGFTGTGVHILSFVIPVEMVGRNWRPLCAVPLFTVCGGMLLSLMAFLLSNWRYLSGVTAAMGLPLLISWWFIPESARWHLQKGHNEQADAIIQNIADSNGKEFQKISKAKTIDKIKPCILKYSYCDLFRGRAMVRNIIIMTFIWSICSISYQGNSKSLGTFLQNPYINKTS